jgi:N-acyl-D-aspartate/D-glutamate deacylase
MQQAVHAPDRWISQMSWVDSMVARGHDVKAQVSCRPIGVLLGLEATANPFMLCPSMGTLATLSLREKVAALSEPSFRARVLQEHERITPTVGPGILRELTSAFDSMFRLSDPVDYEMSGNRSLGAQALREGTEAAGLVYDELLADEGRRLVYLPLFNFAGGTFDVLEAMLNAPNTLLGLSDAGAHCGAICDASIPTTLLSLWARDRRDGPRMALERAVHLTTARNARHMGWHDRGVVAPGMLADLNLIEFDTLECRAPTIVHDLPAGGRRLMQTATGYRYTIKSGVVTFEDGQHTGATPGELLRAQR